MESSSSRRKDSDSSGIEYRRKMSYSGNSLRSGTVKSMSRKSSQLSVKSVRNRSKCVLSMSRFQFLD